jgi:hypothetical protein
MDIGIVAIIWVSTFLVTAYYLDAAYIQRSFSIGLSYLIGIFLYLLSFQEIRIFLEALPLLLGVLLFSLLFKKKEGYSRLHPQYLLNKFIEVLFQQIGIYALFIASQSIANNAFEHVAIATIFFILVHLGLYAFYPWERATFFLVATILFGWIFFASHIAGPLFGIVFNMFLHFGGYLLLGIVTQKRQIEWLEVK